MDKPEALTADPLTFERIVTMRPAFHRVHTDPGKKDVGEAVWHFSGSALAPQ